MKEGEFPRQQNASESKQEKPKTPSSDFDPEEPENKKEINRNFESTKEAMKSFWGIDNLSNIEALRLRQIVGDVFKEHTQIVQRYKGKEVSDHAFFASIQDEAIERWLYDLYGIKHKDVHWRDIIDDNTTGETYYFDYKDSSEAKLKESEIKKQGHVPIRFTEPTEGFKEYLRRIREKAHRP